MFMSDFYVMNGTMPTLGQHQVVSDHHVVALAFLDHAPECVSGASGAIPLA